MFLVYGCDRYASHLQIFLAYLKLQTRDRQLMLLLSTKQRDRPQRHQVKSQKFFYFRLQTSDFNGAQ
jgi:hypothetical protein